MNTIKQRRFKTSFNKVLLSLLTGWLLCLNASTILVASASLSVEYVKDVNLVLFVLFTLLLALPFFIIDGLHPKDFVAEYSFVGSLILFAFSLMTKGENMYKYLFIFLLVMITLYCFNKKVEPEFIHRQVKRKTGLIIIASFTAFALMLGILLALFRYLTYSSPGYDFGIFSNMFYNMKKDFSMITTCERDKTLSHLAVHISPIFYLLLPIYYLFPYPATLNILQPIIIFSGVIPLYLLATKLKLTQNSKIFLCIAYAFYAPISSGQFYDLHENCFMVPLLLWLFYFFESGKNIPMFIFALLTLTVKEDAFIYVAIFALYVIVARKGYLKGSAMIVISLAYFALACFILTKYGEGIMESRFGNLENGGGLFETAKTLLTNTGFAIGEIFKTKDETPDKIFYALQLLCPLAFLPLRSKKFARYFLILPIFVNLLTQYKYQYNINYQYSFSIAAFLFYLSVLNLSEMEEKKQDNNTFAAIVAGVLLFTMLVTPKSISYIAKYDEYKEDYKTLNTALEQIPDNASVTASAFLVPHLAQRDIIYEDEYHETPSTEYFVLDIRNTDVSDGRADKYIEAGYELIYQADGIVEIYQNTQMAS